MTTQERARKQYQYYSGHSKPLCELPEQKEWHPSAESMKVPTYTVVEPVRFPRTIATRRAADKKSQAERAERNAVKRANAAVFVPTPGRIRKVLVKRVQDAFNQLAAKETLESLSFQYEGLLDGIKQSMNDSVERTTSQICRSLDSSIKDTTERLTNALKEQCEKAGNAAETWIMRLGASLAALFIMFWLSQAKFNVQTVTVCLSFVGIGLSAFFHKELYDAVWPLIEKLFKRTPSEEMEYEGFSDHIGSFSIIIVTILSSYCVGSRYSLPAVAAEIIRTSGTFPTATRGMSDFFAQAGAFVTNIINSIIKFFGGKNLLQWKTADSEINDFCDRVNTVLIRYKVGEEVFNADDIDTLIYLRKEASSLSDKHRKSPLLNAHIERMIRSLDEMLNTYGPTRVAMRGDRVQPVSTFLIGGPGTGKTVAMKMLAAHIVYTYLSPEALAGRGSELGRHMYVQGTDQFFTGYNQQLVWVWDDMFQNVHASGDTENDFSKLIGIVNPFSQPLRMAAIEDKGKVFANSPAFIATTNMTHLESATRGLVASKDAILRRMHHTVELVPNACVMTDDKFDFAKFTSMSTEQQYMAWTVYDFNIDTGKRQSRTRSFAEFAKDVVEHMFRNQALAGDHREALNNQRDYLLKLRQGGTQRPRRTELHHWPQFEAQAGEWWWPSFWTTRTEEPVVEPVKDDMVEIELNPAAVAHAEFVSYKDYCKDLFLTVLASDAYKFISSRQGMMILLGSVVTVCAALALYRGTQGQGEDSSRDKNKGVHHTKDVRIASVELPAKGTTSIVESSGKPTRAVGTTERLEYHGLAEFMVAKCKATSNSYDVYIEIEGAHLRVGAALFVRTNYAVMPYHYFILIREYLEERPCRNVIFKPTFGSKRNSFSMEFSDFMNLENHYVNASKDVTVVKVPNVTAHSDIVNFFVTEDDLRVFRNRFVPVVIDFSSYREGTHTILRHHTYTTMEIGPSEIAGRMNDRTLTYSANTAKGDCGSVVYFESMNATMQRQMVGLHVGGAGGHTGCCNIITQEMLNSALEQFSAVIDEGVVAGVVVGETARLAYEGFETLGEMSRAMNLNRNSTLRQSKIVWERVSKPAMMYPKKGINPMRNAMEGYAGDVIAIPQSKLDEASVAAFHPLMSLTARSKREVLKPEEAIRSTLDNKGIPRSTSAGYPYCVLGITKRALWGRDGEYDFSSDAHRALMLEVEEYLAMAKQNIRGLHIFADFLKDELRSPEKVLAGKTRLVSACPVLYNILVRMYFLDFTNAVQETRIHNGVCVGINPYTEWTVLAEKLLRKGDNLIAGDFSGFDKAQVPQILWSICDRINEWYGDCEENQRVRRVLWYEVVHSRHIGGDGFSANVLYQWHKSLPSGHPLTSFINSFYNLTCIACCWYEYAQGKFPDVWSAYRLHVQPCVYGDDNLISVSDKVAAFEDPFDQAAVTEFMTQVGMTYTNEQKNDEEFSYRPLTQVEFLKRSFTETLKGGRKDYLPTLRVESVIQMVLWERGELSDKDMYNTFNTFFTELSLHDKATWGQYSEVFRRQAGVHYGYTPSYLGIPFTQEAFRAHSAKMDTKY